MAAAHARFGKLTWQQDLAPAIRYANEGFLVTPQLIGIRDGARKPFDGLTNFKTFFGEMKAGRISVSPSWRRRSSASPSAATRSSTRAAPPT
jgi:gamma-glutamyltranspeptidase/glutathione hydrolase